MARRARPALSQGAASLLTWLCAPEKGRFGCQNVLVVAAHPDDETIALGGQLSRMEGVRMLHVTDGAPVRNMSDALACGFTRREDYADARRRELADALAIGGVGQDSLLSLDIPDQTAAFRMADAASRLSEILRQLSVSVILTHAYEGGHPDHDATAFIVHAACHLLARSGLAAPEVLEFPLYHARQGRMIVQEFPLGEGRAGEWTALLDEEAIATKRRMLARYLTQRRTLQSFATATQERFRRALPYDFEALPNGGDVFYAHFQWGLRPAEWPALVESANRELDLPRWL